MAKTRTEPTEEEIIQGIGDHVHRDLGFAVHVLQTIWDAQQEVEKVFGTYAGSDGKGFQEWETRKWNDFLEARKADGWSFTPTQARELQDGMYKYRRQYRKLTRPRVEAVAERLGA
jgi:hypothetical protein